MKPPLAFSGLPVGLYDPQQDKLPLDFRIGRPDASLFPIKPWRRLVIENLSGAAPSLVQYRDPGGLHDLRKAIAEHVRAARGIQCTPDNVIVVGGCQEGLNMIARLLIKAGDPVVVEDPCYKGAAYVLQSYGSVLIPVPVDDRGLVVEAIPAKAARVAYVTPSHQFPLGPTLPLERRLALLEWAGVAGAYIVEDDYDSDFRYEGSPLMSLHALDRGGCVIYLGTFSKSIGAGLRLGYAIVPEPLIEAARAVKGLTSNGHPWLEQAVVADFIGTGGFERHLVHIRSQYMRRRDVLLREVERRFGGCRVDGVEGGMHVTWHLPRSACTAFTLQQILRKRGVGIYSLKDGPACQFKSFDGDDRVVTLGYACLTEKKIVQAVEIISDSVETRGGRVVLGH